VFPISTTKGDIKILSGTGYKAHLIIGTYYGADAEGTLLVNGEERNFTATVTRNAFNEVEVLIIPDIPLKKNDIVVFTSETLFGLNVNVDVYDIKVVANVALQDIKITVDDVVFDSSSLVIVFNGSVNFTETRKMLIKIDGETRKVTSPQSSDVTMVLKVNDVVAVSQVIRTISNINNRGVFMTLA
ncbi:MAG: hypothetical protein QQN55_08965, partial [Nitrosopumilus sp.]